MIGVNLLEHRLPEGEPVEAPDRFRPADHEGKLLLFFPVELRTGVESKYGTQDAVACARIVNLDTGQVFRDALVFGTALTANIGRGVPDSPVLGRLGKGTGTPGQTKPWVLFPHDQPELDKALAWMKANT